MSSLSEDAKALQELLDSHRHIVFFGGAGVSTESGIPDFRSVDGLYHQKYRYDPETIISHGFFESDPTEFYRFYRDKMLLLDKKPNASHYFLAELEKAGKLDAIVTQNIDGLHQMAGSRDVIELHGTIHRNFCEGCGKMFDAQYIKNYSGTIPLCDKCHSIIKPDVVLYGEPLDEMMVTKAIVAISQCDMLIVAGTSLVVYPAASFIDYFQGKDLVLINKDERSFDSRASLIIHRKVGELFERLHV